MACMTGHTTEIEVGDRVIERMPEKVRREQTLSENACGQVAKFHYDGSVEIRWDSGAATNVNEAWVRKIEDRGISSDDNFDFRNQLHVSSRGIRAEYAFCERGFSPLRPTDEHFEFSCTTVTIGANANPHHIANALLEFLDTGRACGLSVAIKKVSHQKFAIKVEMMHNELVCLMKVQIYQLSHGKYAVQFQRRQGDCICFVAAYMQALEHLRACFEQVQALSDCRQSHAYEDPKFARAPDASRTPLSELNLPAIAVA